MSTQARGVRCVGRGVVIGMITLAGLTALTTGMIAPTQAVAADAVTDANVAAAIAAAKTQQDHDAIAAYFRAQAAAEADKVKLHEAMLKSWEKTVSGRSLEVMRRHCNDLIASFRKMQKSYEMMAQQEEKMGKSGH